MSEIAKSKRGSKPGEYRGGRAKGTLNQGTIDAKALADRMGVDPLEILLNAAKGDWKALGFDSKGTEHRLDNGEKIIQLHISIDHRIASADKAAKYIYPQRKAIEVTDTKDLEKELEQQKRIEQLKSMLAVKIE